MVLAVADKRPHPKFRFLPDADRSATLPAYYFFDPEIYEREKEAVFYKTWQFAGYLHDLRNPGDFITTEIIDQKILVVRAKDQQLRAFYNVCMHRGHVLAEGSGNRSFFTCPFHAWSYDTTGALKAAGNAENFTSPRFASKRLPTWHSLIWIRMRHRCAAWRATCRSSLKASSRAFPNFISPAPKLPSLDVIGNSPTIRWSATTVP